MQLCCRVWVVPITVVTTGKREQESPYWLCECVFCCMNVGACVFHYLADAVNYIFPESCQPLMKARAWLVQCYSWDPEELDLLGRKPTIATSPSLPPPHSSLLLPPSVPPTSPKETTWQRLIHADGYDYFTHLPWLWFVRMQHYYYTVWLPCSFGKKSMIFTYKNNFILIFKVGWTTSQNVVFIHLRF